MKTGVYMVEETGVIFILIACTWSKDYSLIITGARGKTSYHKIAKRSRRSRDIVYIGEYL